MWHPGSYFPIQGLNMCPLQWKRRAVTTALPRKSCRYDFEPSCGWMEGRFQPKRREAAEKAALNQGEQPPLQHTHTQTHTHTHTHTHTRQGFLYWSPGRNDLSGSPFLPPERGPLAGECYQGAVGTAVPARLSPADPLDPPPPATSPAPALGERPLLASGGLAWRIFVCDTIVIWAPFGRSKLSCLHSARLK